MQYPLKPGLGKLAICRGDRDKLLQSCFTKHSTDMEIPSTVVGWLESTSRRIVQKSGVKNRKLTRCGQKFNFFRSNEQQPHLKLD